MTFSKEDKAAWGNSEIMQELEKIKRVSNKSTKHLNNKV